MTGVILGSPAYMAPEQASGDPRQVGPATDQFGLGAILYEMLTGFPPHAGSSQIEVLEAVITSDPEPPSRRRPDLDPALEAICMRCLAREPERRWSSMDELARALEGWGLSSSRASRRGPSLFVVLAGGTALVSAGLAVLALASAGRDPGTPASDRPQPSPIAAELSDLLSRASDCRGLLEAAAAAASAGVGPEDPELAERVPDPGLRAKLLFALHVREGLRDTELLFKETSAVTRLLHEAPGPGPWRALGLAVVEVAKGPGLSLAEVERALEGAGGEGEAWRHLLRASARWLARPQADSARGDLDRALELDPSLWAAAASRAEAELSESRYTEALAILDRYPPCLPECRPALVVARAEAHRIAGDRELAWWILRGLEAEGWEHARLLLKLAELELDLRHTRRAIGTADRLIHGPYAPPHQGEALSIKGYSQAQLQDWQGAAESYLACYEQTRQPEALRGWVHARIELGQAEAALRALDGQPGPRPAWLEELRGELTRAVEARARVAPRDATLKELQELAQTHRQAQDHRAWLMVCDRVLETWPRSRSALMQRAQARRELGHHGATARDLRRASELRPLDDEELRQLAIALHESQQYAEAVDVLGRCLVQEPRSWGLRAMLTSCLIELGRWDRVDQEMDRLESLAQGVGEQAGTTWLRVRILYERQDPSGALALLRALPRVEPGAGVPPSAHLDELQRRLERIVAWERDEKR